MFTTAVVGSALPTAQGKPNQEKIAVAPIYRCVGYIYQVPASQIPGISQVVVVSRLHELRSTFVVWDGCGYFGTVAAQRNLLNISCNKRTNNQHHHHHHHPAHLLGQLNFSPE